jgi:hypothetical protein
VQRTGILNGIAGAFWPGHTPMSVLPTGGPLKFLLNLPFNKNLILNSQTLV